MIKLDGKKEFIQISFSRLLKLEVKDLAQDVAKTLERHEPEELKLKEIYDLFVANTPVIDELVVKFRGHPITKKLKRLRDERALYVSAINFDLRKVTKLDLTREDDAVLTLNSEITRFLDKLSKSKNEKVMHQKIGEFILEVGKNEELSEAMTSLGFVEHLTNLELVLSKTVGQLDRRKISISARPKAKTNVLKKSVITSIENVLDEIGLQQLKNPDLHYGNLIDELNGTLNEFAILINKRKFFNERKAEQKRLESEAGAPDTNIEKAGDIMPQLYGTFTNGSNMQPEVQGMSYKGLNTDESAGINHNLDNKDVAASSSKALQLPDASDNDHV